jgi:ferric-dicitrate binding protein FerR (iron transport regulator)
MNDREDRETVDWLAFQYIANELDDTARNDFESRLLDDQAAREAVARAVLLSQAVADFKAPVALRPRKARLSQSRAAALAVSLCLLIGALAVTIFAFGARRSWSDRYLGDGAESPASVDSDRLAALWLDARSAFPVESDSSKDGYASTDGDALPADDWMFEAISPDEIETDPSDE